MLRPWQQYFVNRSLEELKEGKKVIAINSPTGSGKTLTALKIIESAIELGIAKKSLFAVRTVTQLLPPLRDVERFGLRLKAVPLIGKEKACPAGYAGVNLCPQCSWRDRVGEPPASWTEVFSWIESTIRSFKCPYVTLKELSKDADLVVLSYQYLSPDILPKLGTDLKEALIVVDEAHNLLKFVRERKFKLDRAIGLLSSYPKLFKSLNSTEGVKEVVEVMKTFSTTILSLINVLRRLKGFSVVERPLRVTNFFEVSTSEIKIIVEALERALPKLVLEAHPAADLAVQIRDVLEAFTLLESGHGAAYLEGDSLVIRELKPWISKYVNESKGLILLSGTLHAKQFLETVLSAEVVYLDLFDNEYLRNSYFNLFNPNNVMYLFITDYSSKYKLRNDPVMMERRKRIELACYRMVARSGGTCLMVYPSYSALSLAKPHLSELSERGEVNVIVSERGLGHKVLEAAKRGASLVAAVAGDQLTEGVELVDEGGSSIIRAVAVLGAPFPSPSPYLEDFSKAVSKGDWKKTLEKLYEEEMLVKVKQAVGRLVRSPSDSGVVILADTRFLNYKEVLAKWYPKRFLSSSELLEMVS